MTVGGDVLPHFGQNLSVRLHARLTVRYDAAVMFCRNCGSQLPDRSAYCESCGAATGRGPAHAAPPAYHPAAKSRLAAGLLGIFAGSIGVHRFYLGHVGLGIVQIIVTLVTFGIGGLWGFVEGIVILAGGINTDARGVPLRE